VNVVKLSHATSYALHALVYIASQKPDQPVASHTIAEATGLPEGFLLKVLKPLTAARILVSLKGPNGGYRLARPTDQITLLEVLETVDGSVQSEVPVVETEGGMRTPGINPQLQKAWDRATKQVRQRLRKVSVRDLVGKSK
jgi:Rrf2 family protein